MSTKIHCFNNILFEGDMQEKKFFFFMNQLKPRKNKLASLDFQYKKKQILLLF